MPSRYQILCEVFLDVRKKLLDIYGIDLSWSIMIYRLFLGLATPTLRSPSDPVILRNNRRFFCDFNMSQLYTEKWPFVSDNYNWLFQWDDTSHVYGVSSVLITGLTWAINAWYFPWSGEFLGFYQRQTINKNAGIDLHKQMKHPPLWFHGTSLRLHVPCNVDNAREPGTGTGSKGEAWSHEVSPRETGYFNLFYPYTACREHVPRFSTKIT